MHAHLFRKDPLKRYRAEDSRRQDLFANDQSWRFKAGASSSDTVPPLKRKNQRAGIAIMLGVVLAYLIFGCILPTLFQW